MRLTKDDLKKIARLVDEGYSSWTIAPMFNYSRGGMQSLVGRYRIHGLEGILHSHSKSFSVEEKIAIINRIYSGESQRSLAIELNVNDCVVHQWVSKYERLGYNGLIDNRGRPGVTNMGRKKKDVNSNAPQVPLTDPEREELNELRRKTYYQQMEIDCLKKIQALVQQRQNRQTKKKQ